MAVGQVFTNNAITKLVSSVSAQDTQLFIHPNDSIKFHPLNSVNPEFQIATIKQNEKIEIVKITTNYTDGVNYLVVERAQEGTVAQSFEAGADVYAAVTAAWFQSVNDLLFPAP